MTFRGCTNKRSVSILHDYNIKLKKGIFDYETVPGNVKHFFGYIFALGGIVSINGADFENINGFPNFWAWGYEDNLLQYRVERSGIKIDRTQFYQYMDKNIIQMKDDIYRPINKTDFNAYKNNTNEGVHSITNLGYNIDESNGFVNVYSFHTGREENLQTKKQFDRFTTNTPFVPENPNPIFGNLFASRTNKKSTFSMVNSVAQNSPPSPPSVFKPINSTKRSSIFKMKF